MSEQRQLSCAERVAGEWADRKSDLTVLWKEYCDEDFTDEERKELDALGHEEPNNEEPLIYEYGLSFDYVWPGTFEDQNEGYWRYQLSYGGPSDEIRFYGDHNAGVMHGAHYWFMDWFDGAEIRVTDDTLVTSLWEWFKEGGSLEHAYDQAQAGE